MIPRFDESGQQSACPSRLLLTGWLVGAVNLLRLIPNGGNLSIVNKRVSSTFTG
jgi:hypothetical protein